MNKRRWISCLLAALEISAMLMGATGCAANTGPGIFYRVKGGNSEMYLLGSIHVGNRDLKHFGPHIRRAMKGADVFVFECDTTSPEAQQAVFTYQLGDKPLREALTPETYARLEEAAKKTGLSMGLLDRYHPWAVASMLTTLQASDELDAARAQDMGIEEAVWSKVNGREVRYLETPEMQLEALRSFSPELQDAMVLSGCELILEPSDNDIDKWPQWWQQGENPLFIEAYAKENNFASPELLEEYQSALLTRRNQRMADSLDKMLQEEGRSFFVTMGLYHLVLPDDSVILNLREKGYIVERVFQ